MKVSAEENVGQLGDRTTATGYDSPALRFCSFCADRLVAWLVPAPGTKVLDIAAGTGAVALAAAQAVGARGRVIAIDLSEAMLGRLQSKIDKFGLTNIDVFTMDAARPEFRSEYFDYTISSFGLGLLSDMTSSLAQWARVTRPGGKVVFASLGARAFAPFTSMFYRRLRQYGVETPGADSPEWPFRLSQPRLCEQLLASVGLVDIATRTLTLGYHVAKTEEWWDILRFSGLFGTALARLSAADREQFRQRHMADAERERGEQGLWLNVEVVVASGSRTAR